MKLWRTSRSIQHKTITAIVLVGLLPLTLSLLLTYFEERRALRETLGVNFKGIAVEAARKIETQITRGINEAQQLATIPFIRDAVQEANRQYLGKTAEGIKEIISERQRRWQRRKARDEFPAFINLVATDYLVRWHALRKSDYLAIIVTDDQGALVLSSFPQVKFYYGESSWWNAAFDQGQRQAYVGDLSFDPSFGTHVLKVAVPFLDDTLSSVVGAVSILLRRDSLFHSISEVTAGVTGHAMLMAADGSPLICPVLSLEEHSASSDLVQAISQAKAGWVNPTQDSHGAQDSIVGFAHLRFGYGLAKESFGGRQWVTSVRQDPEESYAPLNQLLIKVAVYGVVVFGILLGTGVIVARRIVKPIQSLRDGVQRIGSGSLDYQLELKTGDEIEDLADAFNKMARNLTHSFNQLSRQMDEIRRLEGRYRDLIENSPEMIHQLDRDGRFVHANKTELEKLGYTLDEMRQMYLWDIVPSDDKPKILEYFNRLTRKGLNTIETVFLTKERVRIAVEVHSTALIDPETGNLVYTRAFVRDITDRKMLQEKLQQYTLQLEEEVQDRTHQLSQSEFRYKALFNFAADSIVTVDHTGFITAVNERERHVFGHSESTLVGKSLLEVIPTQHRGTVIRLLDKVIQGEEKIPQEEVEVLDGSSRLRPVEMDLVRVTTGSDPLVMVQLRDIAERKQLETKLLQYSDELEAKVQERTREIQEAKHYIESLLENANDVIYTLDNDQRFTYVNSKVEIWGYRKEDLIGRSYLSLLSKRHRGRRLKDILDLGRKQVYEIEVMSRTGEHRSVMVSVSPLASDKGISLGILGIARDITERKKLEQQIQNSEKLASIGKLAAGVAHEVNNPLGGILNCLYNIRRGTLTGARQEEYLGFMEDGLRRVQKIVRQLLDFSQQHDPELAASDLNGIVERVLVLTNHALVANRLHLYKEFDPELPPLMIDSHMMEQVLMNLILNAIQASPQEGQVTIRTKKSLAYCEVEVEDSGAGIPPEIRPRVFDPFFTTKKTGEGTGLGLSVSLGIVERHGGQILVDSEVGKGAVFTVRLPLTPMYAKTSSVC